MINWILLKQKMVFKADLFFAALSDYEIVANFNGSLSIHYYKM